ncbi:MAG: aminoacyl-tRNA hydrolase [Clostridia bacterium]|nr:aminoacyl-tRNA hydrolase [Clostridia bacterium]
MGNIFDLFKQIAKKESDKSQPITWIVASLGNPGEKYARTRHNAGFLAMDYLCQKYGNIKLDKLKFHALVGEATIGGARVLLMKPQTMMNLSGTAIKEASDFYKISPDHILVISDEIALAPGRLRLRKKGSAGGHNGLKDIIAKLGSEEFPRLRIGVGSPTHPDYDLVDWVLGEFPKEDHEALFSAFGCAAEGVELVLSGKFDEAVALCNSHTGETA